MSVSDPQEPVAGKRRDWGLPLLALFAVTAYGALAIGSDSVKTLSLVFSSIMLEAAPFMLFGAFVGGLIEAFVSRERMTALLPKRGWVTVFVSAGMGLIFPVCECAVVPVVRRLARKGLPPSAAIAYLLGGPIVNPIVIASTALAYKFDWRVVMLRTGVGYVIAVMVALVIGWVFDREPVFREDLCEEPRHADNASHAHHVHDYHDNCHDNHNHEHAACSCGCGHSHQDTTFGGKIVSAFRHAADDFVSVGHFLVIGAFIAALAQTYIDRKVFLGLADYPLLPSVLMIALAVLLNLCSEADAFIAASFRGLMPLSAQMAFMLAGPMFDLKLLLMYQGVFRRRAIFALAGLILAAVACASFGMELSGGLK